MASIKAGNIQKNNYILHKGAPHRVTYASFFNPGKGSAVMRLKLRNVISGAVIEHTFKSNESVEEADVEKKELQFLYDGGDAIVFMDPRTYDQVEVDREIIGEKLGLFTPDMTCQILFFSEKPVGIVLPPNVVLTVTVAEEVTAGNRVNAPKKPVTLETGLEVQAPLFIKPGDKISVDTETLEYLARVVQN